jgi:hypothetical protein
MIHAFGNPIYGGWLVDNGLGKKILQSQCPGMFTI